MPTSNELSETLIKQLISHQKSERRWKNIRFFILLILFCLLFFSGYSFIHHKKSTADTTQKDYVALIRLNGYIFPGSPFSAEKVIPLLNDAFADTQAKGVVIDINSGGGSPVQSSIIHDKILELKAKYQKPVIVVGEDILASGAYMVAVAGDKIYVNQDTITGSIGVVMEGFGFNEAIKKIGVSRRVFTAGKNKVQMDPFEPLSTAEVAKTKKVLDEVHQHFIAYVQQSRGNRLKGDKSELFSGDFWTGSTALTLGIVDGVGNLSQVLPKEFHTHYYVDYSEEPSLLESIKKQLGTTLDFALEKTQPRLAATM